MEKKLLITQRRSMYIQRCLTEQLLAEGETISDDVTFDDGMLMSIKCCGSQDEPAWTEAVLFVKGEGQSYTEVACSDASDEYLGEWSLEYEGKPYTVEVVEQ